jgi:hypothetical protein
LQAGNATTLTNTLNVNGIAEFGNQVVNSNTTLLVGNANANGTVQIAGATSISNTLLVTGAANVNGTVEMQGPVYDTNNLNVNGTLQVGGATSISNTLLVTGAQNFNGTAEFAGPVFDTNNLNVNGTLQTGGATTLSNTLNVNGTSEFGDTVTFTNHFGMATNTHPTITFNTTSYGSYGGFYPGVTYKLSAGATDYQGTLTVTNGGGTGGNTTSLFTNTFSKPFINPPTVVVCPGNANMASVNFLIYVISTKTNFVVYQPSGGGTTQNGTVYVFNYIVSGQ